MIGRSGKGYATHIAFDLSDPMGASSCVSCGECVAACPTGALTNKPIRNIPIRPRTELDAVDTVCPYCGVGCALTYYVDRDKGAIAYAEGREQPGSHGRLCVKGRYGWDYAASPQRLTVPLIRREESYPKGALSADVRGDMDSGGEANDHGMTNDGNPRGKRKGGKRGRKPGGLVDYAEVLPHFREATWEEALDLVARRLSEIYAEGGPAAIAGFGSAKCSNEEAYLFQKLIRTGFHTNNVDHCTRLCHASSVAALFEGIGSGAVSTTYGDVINAEVAIVTGSNSHGQPPGRLQLLQAGQAERHDDHLRRPAGRQDGRPRGHLLPAQARHRRRLLQRRDARGDQARPDRRRLHRRPHLQLRGAAERPSPTTRRSAPSRSPACPPT